jgi:hypothetical protein
MRHNSALANVAFTRPSAPLRSCTVTAAARSWHRRDDGHYETIRVPEAIAAELIDSPFKEPIRTGVSTMSFAIPFKTIRSFLAGGYDSFDGSGPRSVQSLAAK